MDSRGEEDGDNFDRRHVHGQAYAGEHMFCPQLMITIAAGKIADFVVDFVDFNIIFSDKI